jgi:hypothetical protein
MLGKHHSKKTKKKISLSKMGHKSGMTGKKHTIQSRQKMRKSKLGEKNNRFGKKHTKKSIEKIKASNNTEEILKIQKEKHSGKNNYWFGKHHSEETKRKLRLSTIERLKKTFGSGACPSYNPKACKIIDDYGKKNGYNFQHALNGGEFYIENLGYWVDGYDKEKNIVIEVDEHHHFDALGNLKRNDILRQKQIKKSLQCKFIRIKLDESK